MRTYAKFNPLDWIEIAPHLDQQTFYVYIYLRTCSIANCIGLYYMPEDYIAFDTKLPKTQVSNSLMQLQRKELVYVDSTIRHVYLTRMAREELGAALLQNDKRRIAVQNIYDALPASILTSLFYIHYGTAFNLTARPDHDQDAENRLQNTVQDTPIINAKSKPIPTPTPELQKECQRLLSRYTQTQLEQINEAKKHLASTRASGKLSDSVWLKILRSWDMLAVERVMYGIETYIDRNCALDHKKENYLLAIMKNVSQAELNRKNPQTISEITSHNLVALEEAKRRMKDGN